MKVVNEHLKKYYGRTEAEQKKYVEEQKRFYYAYNKQEDAYGNKHFCLKCNKQLFREPFSEKMLGWFPEPTTRLGYVNLIDGIKYNNRIVLSCLDCFESSKQFQAWLITSRPDLMPTGIDNASS